MKTAADNPFAAILSEGETILWQGQPDIAVYRKAHQKEPSKIMAWLFVALAVINLMAFCLYRQAALTPLWIVLFFIQNVSAVFFAGYMIRADKNFVGFEWYYAVTNKRVLFQHPAEDGPYTEKLAIAQITKVYLQPEASPTCALIFERKLFLIITERINFYISDAAEVQELVVSLLMGVK